MSFLRRHSLLLVCALIGMGLLSGLGVWQLQRLAWKESVLAQISSRRDAPPRPCRRKNTGPMPTPTIMTTAV